jgi:Xaa-Pro aminopeptidase
MADESERINTPISTKELERRWAAVRAAMEAEGIDVLLMQGNQDFMGGYVKYFTDLPATNGYTVTVTFPREEGMTMISQGPFGMDRQLPLEGDGIRRGVKRVLTTPSYVSAHYTNDYDSQLAEKALEGYSGATIGLVGTGSISYALVDYLKRGRFSNARFVDASELVDRIKVIKSPEEIALIRRTAAMQDLAMEAAFKAIEPGKRDLDIAAVAEHVGHTYGSEQGIFLCASGPVGTPAANVHRHLQHRVVQKGDQFALLCENNGPGGFFTELGRTCVLGKASDEMKEEFDFVLRARKFTLDLLKPGASCKDIWEGFNEFMRENGRPEERRLYCHGQGYDMVERPLVRFDEPMRIQRDMNIVVHPTYVMERTFNWICDNYIIGENGPLERIHKFPEKIVELG